MNIIRMSVRSLFTAPLFAAALLTACSSADDGAPANGEVSADQTEVVKGVPDHGEYPAVIAIDIGESALCTGALIAPDIVLTARHCVSKTSESVSCPAAQGDKQITGNRGASTLKILVGDDIASSKERAKGVELFVPKGNELCDEDIALVRLDKPIDDVEPLEVRSTGIAKGDHVIAVGFGKNGDTGTAGTKLVRQHVKVLETTAFEFTVGEATCQGDSGGPALDENTGEIVGVVSRGGPACDGTGAHNIYTRADAFSKLIDEALAKSKGTGKKPTKDAGKSTKKPGSDLGAGCFKGSDCAAGVCVTEHGKRYCSRDCDAQDKCPTKFACEKESTKNVSVCVEK
jgi:V8-like Glu-specific endopeptidase